MTYILSAQLDTDDPVALSAFQRYQQYVRDHRSVFPPSAFELASSDWYFDSRDHRCPHDGRLERFELLETAAADQSEASLSLRLDLRGAYLDGTITLLYPRVFAYHMTSSAGGRGHCDWRYDELRVTPDGRLHHEIEWWGRAETARWLIEASDVKYAWHPDQLAV